MKLAAERSSARGRVRARLLQPFDRASRAERSGVPARSPARDASPRGRSGCRRAARAVRRDGASARRWRGRRRVRERDAREKCPTATDASWRSGGSCETVVTRRSPRRAATVTSSRCRSYRLLSCRTASSSSSVEAFGGSTSHGSALRDRGGGCHAGNVSNCDDTDVIRMRPSQQEVSRCRTNHLGRSSLGPRGVEAPRRRCSVVLSSLRFRAGLARESAGFAGPARSTPHLVRHVDDEA